jgi:hypothetical protein
MVICSVLSMLRFVSGPRCQQIRVIRGLRCDLTDVGVKLLRGEPRALSRPLANSCASGHIDTRNALAVARRASWRGVAVGYAFVAPEPHLLVAIMSRALWGALAVRDHALIKISIASQLPRAGARLSQLLAQSSSVDSLWRRRGFAGTAAECRGWQQQDGAHGCFPCFMTPKVDGTIMVR